MSIQNHLIELVTRATTEGIFQLSKTNWTDNMSITNQQNFLLTFPNELELIGPAMLGELLSLMSFIRELVT